MNIILVCLFLAVYFLNESSGLTCYECASTADTCGEKTCKTDANGFCFKSTNKQSGHEVVTKGCVNIAQAGCQTGKNQTETCYCKDRDYCNAGNYGNYIRQSGWIVSLVFAVSILKYWN